MKKGLIAILTALLVVLLSVSVMGSTFKTSLSDDYFTRSNPADSEDDDELDHSNDVSYGTATIELVNNSIMKINNVSVYLNYYDQTPSDYDIMQLPGEAYEDEDSKTYYISKIVSQTSSSVDIEFIIPAELDSVDSKGKEKSYYFTATVNYFNGSVNISEDVKVEFKVESALVLKKDKVYFDSDSNSEKCDLVDDDCGTDIDNFVPGENIDMTFALENKLKDISIEDVEVDINFDGDVDDDDLDDSVNRIKKDGSEDESFRIDVDEDAEDTLEIELIATGTDEFGAMQGFRYMFDDLEFNVPDVDMKLNVAPLSESTYCRGDDVDVSFEVINRGGDDQKNLMVRFEDSSLRWLKDSSRFRLDGEDKGDYDSADFDYSFTIPSNVAYKTYNPKITVYYKDEDGDDTTLFTALPVTVVDCTSADSNTDSTTNSDDTTTDSGSDSTDSSTGIVIGSGDDTTTGTTTDTTTIPTGSSVVTATAKDNNTLATVGIVVLIIVLLLVVIGLAVALIRK